MVRTKFEEKSFHMLVGGMFSGKSTELIRIGEAMEKYGTKEVFYFKPAIDHSNITARNGNSKACIFFTQGIEILERMNGQSPSLIIIDETQFASDDIIYIIMQLRKKHHIIAGGIPVDFRGMPFGVMPQLMSIADNVEIMRYGYCDIDECDGIGVLPQRLRDGEPAKADEKIVLVSGSQKDVKYVPRCREHHYVPGIEEYILDKMPWTEISFQQLNETKIIYTLFHQIEYHKIPPNFIVAKVMIKTINGVARVQIIGNKPVEEITVKLTVGS